MGARFASIQHCSGVSNLCRLKNWWWWVRRGARHLYWKSESLVAQSRPTLGEPMDCGPPGSSVHRLLQTILESGNLPDPGREPGSPALQADSFPSEPPGKPFILEKKEVKLSLSTDGVILYVENIQESVHTHSY